MRFVNNNKSSRSNNNVNDDVNDEDITNIIEFALKRCHPIFWINWPKTMYVFSYCLASLPLLLQSVRTFLSEGLKKSLA